MRALVFVCGAATGGTAFAASSPPAAAGASPHLKYMSYYGLDPPVMKGWVNLGLQAIGDGNCAVGVVTTFYPRAHPQSPTPSQGFCTFVAPSAETCSNLGPVSCIRCHRTTAT